MRGLAIFLGIMAAVWVGWKVHWVLGLVPFLWELQAISCIRILKTFTLDFRGMGETCRTIIVQWRSFGVDTIVYLESTLEKGVSKTSQKKKDIFFSGHTEDFKGLNEGENC